MNNEKKTYKVPVEWMVCDFVEVEAKSFAEAVQYVVEKRDIIPLGTEPEYIDGTYQISSEDEVNIPEDSPDYVKALTEMLETFGYGESC